MFLLRHAWPPIGKIEALIGIDEQPPAATKSQRIILSCRNFASIIVHSRRQDIQASAFTASPLRRNRFSIIERRFQSYSETLELGSSYLITQNQILTMYAIAYRYSIQTECLSLLLFPFSLLQIFVL